ncbi:hypothetical protein EMIT0324P_110056 [Pseudomonas chlororaphis]
MDTASHRLSAVAGPASAARPIAAFGSGYKSLDLMPYTHPVAAAEHREAAIDREAGAALELARGPSDLSQPSAAATKALDLMPCTLPVAAGAACDRRRSRRKT